MLGIQDRMKFEIVGALKQHFSTEDVEVREYFPQNGETILLVKVKNHKQEVEGFAIRIEPEWFELAGEEAWEDAERL